MNCAVVILAAGQGTRMCSHVPKLLHTIGGVSILERVVSTVTQLKCDSIVIVHGKQVKKLKDALHRFPTLKWAYQSEPLGTGHAVLQALPSVGDVEQVLIIHGDVPLISSATLQKLQAATREEIVGLITVQTPNPVGLGRIIRDAQGEFLGIVEEKDATPFEKHITEVNAGIWMVSKPHLANWLVQLTNDNAQREYYLTDIVKFALAERHRVFTLEPCEAFEVSGVNDKSELAALERVFQKQEAHKWMKQGVTLRDPNRFDVRGQLTVGRDVVIDINVLFEGEVRLGNQVSIGPNVIIKNSVIQDEAQILANSVIEGAVIGPKCSIGPFARVRPGTELKAEVKVGNFAEIKNTKVEAYSHINHFSYIGDATLGQSVNVGAGTITCNFDGAHKHQTRIGNNVFIGSGTQLVAPVTVGEGATIGAGTTVVKDIPEHQLIHHRVQYRMVIQWTRPRASE